MLLYGHYLSANGPVIKLINLIKLYAQFIYMLDLSLFGEILSRVLQFRAINPQVSRNVSYTTFSIQFSGGINLMCSYFVILGSTLYFCTERSAAELILRGTDALYV